VLVELTIQDLALIEAADLGFEGGLNVVTGETGAGKSLVIGALEFLLGARAKAGLVRRDAERARVEGRFVLELEGYGEKVAAWLREHLPETLEEDGDGEELELILSRTLSGEAAASARSRAHVNHRPVTQRMLRELTERLVEVHGQHASRRLCEPGEQRRLLDAYAGNEKQLAAYASARRSWSECRARLEGFEEGEAERLQRLDLVRFQLEELERAVPDAACADDLRDDRARLRHAAEVGLDVSRALDELSESEDAALARVQSAQKTLADWSAKVRTLAPTAEALAEAAEHLADASASLASFRSELEVDPARLEELEARLADLERIERKYGTDSAGLEQRHAELSAELAELDGAEASEAELAAEEAALRAALSAAARKLSTTRARAVGRLEQATTSGLAELGLEHASFRVELTSRGDSDDDPRRVFGEEGADEIAFLFAANPGEQEGPLREVASGGETARAMLAIRGALAVRRSTPTIVFDEVDAGVGGRLGPEVGRHLAALGRHHQVLCVTHLPAIAAAADVHQCVAKEVRRGRTRTVVTRLDRGSRIQEVASMIAGSGEAASARAEAERLLEDLHTGS